MTSTRVDRLVLPDGYGIPNTTDGLLSWADIETKLEAAQIYWLTSVRPDGRPHVVPRWGVWLDHQFYYDGSPQTRHARNVQVNPACTLNLESGNDVVILEGTSVATSADPESLGAQLAGAFGKYHAAGYEPGADSWSGDGGGGLQAFRPRRAMAWSHFPKDATRFSFDW